MGRSPSMVPAIVTRGFLILPVVAKAATAPRPLVPVYVAGRERAEQPAVRELGPQQRGRHAGRVGDAGVEAAGMRVEVGAPGRHLLGRRARDGPARAAVNGVDQMND